jgi:hypothetical protein
MSQSKYTYVIKDKFGYLIVLYSHPKNAAGPQGDQAEFLHCERDGLLE